MRTNIVTFSKNVFIPLSNACRNRCAYCGFRHAEPHILEREDVLKLLKLGKEHGCKEALFTFGEKPESNPEIRERLEEWGYSNSTKYLYDLCLDAIEIGLLPHSNPGVIPKKDLKLLKDVNASMGLMLESVSERLCLKGMPHEHSPGKVPKNRLKVLNDAGSLGIPFTTGVLIGIGETDKEMEDSLQSLRKIHDRFGYIQEIIIQNFRPKSKTPMEGFAEPPLSRILHALEYAKEIFPDEGLQVPPNLNPGREGVFLLHGANDFGGVSPVTPDYVNLLDSWPTEERLRERAQQHGFVLKERFPVYPNYIDLVPERLRSIIDVYVDKDGLVNVPG